MKQYIPGNAAGFVSLTETDFAFREESFNAGFVDRFCREVEFEEEGAECYFQPEYLAGWHYATDCLEALTWAPEVTVEKLRTEGMTAFEYRHHMERMALGRAEIEVGARFGSCVDQLDDLREFADAEKVGAVMGLTGLTLGTGLMDGGAL